MRKKNISTGIVIVNFILCFSSNLCCGQKLYVSSGIFNTHSDYVQKKIIPMDDYIRLVDSLGTYFIIFEKKGKKQMFNCSEFWGFQYKYKIFRCNTGVNQPNRVMTIGKIVYYENGSAHLEMLKNDSEEGRYSKGAYCYLSTNLLSQMIAMPGSMASPLYKDVEQFKRRNQQYKKLFLCIEEDYDATEIFDCVKEFEKKK